MISDTATIPKDHSQLAGNMQVSPSGTRFVPRNDGGTTGRGRGMGDGDGRYSFRVSKKKRIGPGRFFFGAGEAAGVCVMADSHDNKHKTFVLICQGIWLDRFLA